MKSTITALSMLAMAVAQQVGTEQSETHPRLNWQRCTSGSCSNVNAEVVIDANWRWIHEVGGYRNCYEGNSWTGLCSGADDCAKNCAVEGADYGNTYGVSTSGNALTLKFVQQHGFGKNVGSRMYLMNGDSKYQTFTLLNNEFAFDVDLSTVECGINSALYFVAMKEDGGLSSETNNKAGAKYGTGYCDAQCARDLKFIGGKGNIAGWNSSETDNNAGVGNMGACCAEIDVWESNAHAYALTPHPCEDNNYHICEDDTCGGTYSEDRYGGGCDANGCDYNPYRMGNRDFYGPGKTIDTTRKFTVVTRFEPDRMYQVFIQDGRTITVPGAKWAGIPETSDITPEFCESQFAVFGERDRFNEVGGYPKLNAALEIPMTLVMSIWSDHYANMLWLDSTYPPERAGEPGTERGPCAPTSGVPAEVIEQFPNARVVWSNIRFGPIGSTYNIAT
ncbi:glycosyl hydrolase family 7 [Colletotrichum higginsianum]|uniref:Glucanase n=2 Tax=Colletotrichum higginsianum TaxID=80884 RepID=H1W5V0_COLHI|nr:Glucanase [Colletotrichum higginsianum IMI 349063]OBR04524.1 Glucanase [Colletotrichum higginsianum IMI 349063]TIC89622.1 Exoglucanase 1 [Colletotrichum higginsianum]CCF47864.1 glycosyl hydrolase family 7 [Colletotrichum higginsianum]